MSAVASTVTRWTEERVPLRLLERPVRPAPVAAPTAERRAWRQRLIDAVEAYWAWGEGLRHHRMGSYQQR